MLKLIYSKSSLISYFLRPWEGSWDALTHKATWLSTHSLLVTAGARTCFCSKRLGILPYSDLPLFYSYQSISTSLVQITVLLHPF